MSVNLKEHLKLSFIYTTVAAFAPILQVFIQPVYEGSNMLNAVDFSHLAITELITSLVFALALFSMGNAISRFYYDVDPDSKGYHNLVSGIFTSIIIRGVLIIIGGWLLSSYIGKLFHQPELQDFSTYGYACIITGIGRAVNITAAALFRNEKKILYFILVSMGLGVFRTGFQLIGLFFYDMSFIGYMTGSAIGTSIVTIAILIRVYSTSGFHYDRKLMNEINKFALPLTQYSVIVWALTFADRYLMEKIPTDLGVYNAAVNFAAGIALILQGLQGANQPEVFRVMKEGIQSRQEEIRQFSNMLLMQSMTIVIFSIVPTMLYLDLFYETEVRSAFGLITLIFLRSILRTQFIVFSYPAYYLKKTQIFLFLNTGALLVNLILNYLLIPSYSYYGAIAAGLISDLIMVTGIFIYQKKIVDIKWNKSKTLIFPFSVITFAVICEVIRVQNGLSPYISAACIIVFSFGIMSYLYRNEIKHVINKRWKHT